jgi:DNA-binding PadR family transcriptional regulator
LTALYTQYINTPILGIQKGSDNVAVGMSLMAILENGPNYGLSLRNEFEARTGGIWPLNVGQVYTTLGRLQRDGLVRSEASEGQKLYALTDEGRRRLDDWFAEPASEGPPSREELVLKLVMVARRNQAEATDVIQAERRRAVQLLQEYTLLRGRRRETGTSDGCSFSTR